MVSKETEPRATEIDLSASTITLGVGARLSGSGASLGREMVQAIQMGVDDANEAGGVFGAAVRICVADDEGDERVGADVARRFCDDASILAVIGHYNSNVTLPAASIYEAHGLVMMTPIVSNRDLTERGMSNIFRFTNRDDATGDAISRYLRETLNKRNSVVVETVSTYGKSMADNFTRCFEARGGRVAKRYSVPEGTQDFTNIIPSLPPEFDVLFYGGTFEGAPLLRAMRDAGLSQLFAAGDGCWDRTNFLQPAGSAATEGEGVLILSACPQLGHVRGSREFANRYEARFGPIGNYAVNSFDATCALVAALRQACLKRKGMLPRNGIGHALRMSRHQGIAYALPVAWDKKGDNTAAVTALHVVRDESFQQIAEIERDLPDCVSQPRGPSQL